jgi:hypothetical protein
MMLSFDQLITPVDEETATQQTLDWLTGLGFNATSWQTGSVQLTMVRLWGLIKSEFSQIVSAYTKGGLLGYAEDSFLDYLGEYQFNIKRIPATSAIGTFRLTASLAAPPHSWGAMEILIADQEFGEANVFLIVDAGSINPGDTLDVQVIAQNPGIAANIANNQTLYFRTPLVGVTATNPALMGSTTWIEYPGSDKESNERYTERCLGRWDRLTYGNTDGAYKAWSLEALDALTRVKVITEPLGIVRVIGATATGGLTLGQIDTIEDYINGVTDGVGRRPINDVFSCESAIEQPTPALTIDLVCRGAFAGDVEARTQLAITELLGSIPIGGVRLGVPTTGFVLIADLYSTVMGLQGVENCSFSLTTDLPLGANEIYTPALTINVTVI